MTGIYQHTIDAKGRLFIPARLREKLGETFHVTISFTDKCLSAYSEEGWDRLMARISSYPRVKQKQVRAIFAHAADCELDSQGRILLPQALRAYAGLDKNVAVVGNGETAEFWDADKWAEVDSIETTPEKLAEVALEMDL